MLCFILFTGCQILIFFFETKLKRPLGETKLEVVLTHPDDFNLAEFLSFEAGRAIAKSINFNRLTKTQNADSSTILYFLLKDNPNLAFIFDRALVDFEETKERVKREMKTLSSERIEDLIISCLRISQKSSHETVTKGDLLIYLAKNNSTFKEVLVEHNLYSQDIENLVWWLDNLEEERRKRKRFWDYENLLQNGSLGKEWASAYTVILDQYSLDWTEVIKKRSFEKIIGHNKEIERVERILAQEGNNCALLIGDPGCGKKSIIHMVAKKILFGQSLDNLNYKRVVELDILGVIAQAKTQQQANALLDIIFQEVVRAGNVILVIDELANFLGSPNRDSGLVDISATLYKYLNFSEFRVIGTCDFSGFRQRIETNLSISSAFEKVIVEELSEAETILVLENLVPRHEGKHRKFISYPAIYSVVHYAGKYVANTPFPKKAIDLLDEVMVYASRYAKSEIVLPEHVARIVSEKTRIPVGEMEKTERETLLKLEDLIHQRIINQEEAVKEVSEAMRRARAEITIRKGPIGAFLFLGPTGVGKTETSKALTEIYFGSEERMIRLDMSEFQKEEDISRLIGDGEHEGMFTSKVKENPFSLILLDEIEKAHPDILNLFLQVLDEGFLTDGFGRRIDFKNSIIIATSNAGYKIILEGIEQKFAWVEVKKRILDYVFEQAIFRPEFINRFDGVVIFSPLSKENLFEIAGLMLGKLKDNLALKHIEMEVTPDLKERVVELGYNPIFGAREMRRVVQDKIENVLARALLAGEIGRGDRIKIDGSFQLSKF